MQALCKLAIKLSAKAASNPVTVLKMAPLVLAAGAAAWIAGARKSRPESK